MADLTDASTDSNGDVFGSVRLAGGLAVEKSVHVKQTMRVLSDDDGTSAGDGALYVSGGASVNGHVYLGKDAAHSITLNADLTTTSDSVSISATANNDAGIVLTSSGTNGFVTATASETVTLTGESSSSSGSGGVVLIAGGVANAGFIKLQQNSSSAASPRDRFAIGADGAIAITTDSGSDLVLSSEGDASRVVSLNRRRTEVSRTVTLTDDSGTTPAAATLRLPANGAASVFVTAACALSGEPATLVAELLVGHHSGAAPEPSANTTPPRTGMVRATRTKGSAADGGLDLVVVPDDSNGVAATKDFAIRLYVADVVGAFVPIVATVVIRAEGAFVALT